MRDHDALTAEIDRQRRAQGFLSVAGVLELVASGNSILDPFSTLISASCVIGTGNTFYPQVVLEARGSGSIVVGDGNCFYPQTFFLAPQGCIEVGNQNIFGEGGAILKTETLDDVLIVENDGRYNQGATLLGSNTLGKGSQVLGAITLQLCQLGAGESYKHPDPDLRGGVLKGFGNARGLQIDRGEVISSRVVMQQGAVKRQSVYHPKPSNKALEENK